jgi:[citrate (pro-3S)-lyase] ligase
MTQQEILNSWLALHVRGESLSQFFLDNDIRSCAIYGCDLLGELFYEEAIRYGCEVVAAIDRVILEFHDCRLIRPTDIGELKTVDLIVICMEFTDAREEQIHGYLDDAPFPSAYLSDIINACWYKQIILPYCKAKGVTPYFLSLPMYRHLEGLTDYELAIGAIKREAEFFSQNPEYFSKIYTPNEIFNADYIKNVFTLPSAVGRGQTIANTDIRSAYVNVLGGIRYTHEVPDEYMHAVHILGHCIAFGFGVDDSRTIASQLQKMLNTLPDIYPRIRVINHGVSGSTNDYPLQQLQKLCSLHVHEGDIVVFFYDMLFSRRRYNIHYLQKMCNNSHNAYTTLDTCLNARHDNRILYIDRNHLSIHGMELTAKHIYKLLIQDSIGFARQKSDKTKHIEQVESFGRGEALSEYLSYLSQFLSGSKDPCGAIIMNCNPFTNGHRKLIELAAAEVNTLYIFVVEEDRSVFSFADRKRLIELGTRDLENVVVLPSGSFILSALTFPEYFNKDSLKDVTIDTSLDIEIFAKYVAPTLNIKTRFVGQEPFDPITRQYNQTMKDILPRYGIKFVEFTRYEVSGVPVSASHVRRLLKERKWDEIMEIVPVSTFSFLKEKFDNHP